MEKSLGEGKLVRLNITNDNFHSCLPLKKAEVVGSNPTRSISFILVKYGIELSSFLTIVGQIQQLNNFSPLTTTTRRNTKKKAKWTEKEVPPNNTLDSFLMKNGNYDDDDRRMNNNKK